MTQRGRNTQLTSRIGSHETIQDCLRLLLRPVVRFCIRRSVKLQPFVETAKAVFLEVAREELPDNQESVSRLAAMTGVHRKDVARLIASGLTVRPIGDVCTRVLGQWQNDRRFSKKGGLPKPLSLSGGEGTFSDLVRSVSKELNPYTVLFELERLGAVVREGDELQLRSATFVPKEDPVESFRLVSGDLDDLVQAADANVFLELEVPHLHLSTRYDNVAPEFLPKIRRWFLAEGEKLHKRARNFLSKFDKDMNPKLAEREGRARVSIGTFSIVDESDQGGGE